MKLDKKENKKIVKYILMFLVVIVSITLFLVAIIPKENAIPNLYNSISGKNVLCIGDSITSLDGKTTSGYDNGNTVIVGYQEQFRKEGATVTTKGNSGATIRKYVSTDDMKHGSLVDDIKNSNYNVAGYDIITIFAGTNDVSRGLRLGTLGNESDANFDETTTIGALRSMLEYIRTNNSTCEIYLITPLRSGLDSRPYEKMEQVTEGIISTGNMYGIKVINLLYESGIGKGNIDTFLYDKLHPNNEGFERIGLKIVKEIN